MNTSDMRERVVVVTGGSGGIGSEICRQFAAAGATLVFTYRTGKQAAERLLGDVARQGHWDAQLAVDDSAALATLRSRQR